MTLALVALLVLSAGPGDSPGSEPMQALILGGGKTKAEAERAQSQWEEAQKKAGVRAQAGFPRIVQSGDVQGLKPGFVVTILGYCPASEAQRVLEKVRSGIAGAYVRDVTAQKAECPVLGAPNASAALAAVKNGDLPAVKRALDEGLDVNGVVMDDTRPQKLLITALWARQQDVARLLLERSAEPSSEALGQAASQGSAELVRILLEKKADPNGRIRDVPVLLSAIRSGKPEVVTVLLAAGADAKRTWTAGMSDRGDVAPLYFASACAGGPELLEAFAKQGMDLRATTPQGTTMLVHAINDCFNRQGLRDEPGRSDPTRSARIQALIKAGVDVNARMATGTALHEAIRVKDLEVTQMLLAAGADLALTDKEGNTPLHEAAMSGDPELLKRVLKGGAAVNALNQHQESALYFATWVPSNNVWGMAEPLLEAGADARFVSEKGYSAADWACRHGELELARDLIKRGAPFKDGKPTPKKCTRQEGD